VSPAGGFAEESARLLDAVQSWIARGAGEATPSDSEHPHHSGPECRVCPICQVLSVVRTAKPEVLEHLGDAMTSLAAAFAELIPSEAAPTPRPTTDDVEHIVVTGEDDGPARGEQGAAWA
jgi:hypothetical protein